MPKASEMTGATVRGRKDKKVGVVTQVLFHPNDNRVVGFVVRRPELLFLIRRKPAFVPWPSTASVVAHGDIHAAGGKLLSEAQATRMLGVPFEDTVIWKGMPVTDSSGRTRGTVRDVGVGRSSGTVVALYVSQGGASDVAVGTVKIDGQYVRGFDGTAVQVSSKGFEESAHTGGAAKVAGTTAAYAKVRGEQVVDAAAEGLRNAGVSVDAQKTGRSAGRMLKKLQDAAGKAIDDYESGD